jgi:hypothetical protein
MKIKNLEAAKKLVEKYRSVTLEQIKEKWNYARLQPAHDAAKHLTGFGTTHTCTLCKGIHKPFPNEGCKGCLYAQYCAVI